MRVVIFFDGKNFYSGWKDRTDGRRIDFEKLSEWIVKEAGGADLWGAYYYTSVETGLEAQTDGQRKLAAFLDEREHDRGYFVKRFPRRTHPVTCRTCGAQDRVFVEKEVDTTMVADMLSLAAVSAFDVAVLISGDADHAPAVEGVRALGKKVLVATWAGYGLSPRIRKAAFQHIDLCRGLDHFGLTQGPGAAAAAPHASTQVPLQTAVPAMASGDPGALPAGDPAAGQVVFAGPAPSGASASTAPAPGGDGFSSGLYDSGEAAALERDPHEGHDPSQDHDGSESGVEANPLPYLHAPGSAGGVSSTIQPALRSQAPAYAPAPPVPAHLGEDPILPIFMDELARAEDRFAGGYVGLNFFLTRWRSPKMDGSTDTRRRALDTLRLAGAVDVYDAPDGSKALRLVR